MAKSVLLKGLFMYLAYLYYIQLFNIETMLLHNKKKTVLKQ